MKENEPMLVSISDLARLQHRDKALISRRITALERAGRISAQSGRYGAKLIDVQAYESATGHVIDAEHFLGLSQVIELMARRGKLGAGEIVQRRLRAARSYAKLQDRARDGDSQASELLKNLDATLGVIDGDVLRSVLVTNKTLTEIASVNCVPVPFMTKRFCACLDAIASQLGFSVEN